MHPGVVYKILSKNFWCDIHFFFNKKNEIPVWPILFFLFLDSIFWWQLYILKKLKGLFATHSQLLKGVPLPSDIFYNQTIQQTYYCVMSSHSLWPCAKLAN